MARGVGIAGLVGAAGAAIACAPEAPAVRTCLDAAMPVELPRLARVYATDALEIRSDRPICAGTRAEWQAHAERVAAAIAGEPRRVRLHVFDDAAAVGAWCGPELGTRGCTLTSGVVYSQVDSVTHEIGHAAACTTHVETAGFLAEGFATAYDGRPLRKTPALQAFVDGAADVYTAGHFVRWLIDARGPEAFSDLYAEVHGEDDGERVLEAFAAAYATSFAEIAEAYVATAPAVILQAERCEFPRARRIGEGWSITTRLRCDDPGTFGPHPDDVEAVYAVRVLELAEDTALTVTVAGTRRPYRIESCDPDNVLSPVRVTSDARDTIYLPAGRYRVELLGDEGATVTARFTPPQQ